jgi:gentisate 1,2-dioxygenase
MSKIESLEKLLKTLPEYNVQPLWTVMDAVVFSPFTPLNQVPPLPNPKAVPHIWKYNEIKPLLLGGIKGDWH